MLKKVWAKSRKYMPETIQKGLKHLKNHVELFIFPGQSVKVYLYVVIPKRMVVVVAS
jgi:hypothetical protein